MDLSYGHVGSMHDARMWRLSALRYMLVSGLILDGPSYSWYEHQIPQWIMGDNAYPCLSKLVPVFPKEAGLDQAELYARKRFNMLMSSARILVEQGLGTMKMRFPILRNEMRVKRRNCGRIIDAVASLHNFLLDTGSGYLEAIPEELRLDL